MWKPDFFAFLIFSFYTIYALRANNPIAKRFQLGM